MRERSLSAVDPKAEDNPLPEVVRSVIPQVVEKL
jgi:hypothetical protein